MGADVAFAGLHQNREPGDLRDEGEAIAVARGRPADLPAAAQGAALHLIVQGQRRRQLGAVEGRRLAAGGEQGRSRRGSAGGAGRGRRLTGLGGRACRRLRRRNDRRIDRRTG